MNFGGIQQLISDLLVQDGGRTVLASRLFESALLILLLVVIQRLVYRLINENVHEFDRRHRARVWARSTIVLALVIALMLLWVPSGQTLLQIVALLAAGLALTLSRPISSVLAWMVIMARHPIRIGDRVQFGEVMGDVVDLGLLHVHLLEIGNWVDADQGTGRLVHVPNSVIFDGAVYNYTEAFDLIWNELEFIVSHDSDWEQAREILLESVEPLYEEIASHAVDAAEEMARRYAYQRGITTPFVYVKLLRDGIKLSLRYLIEPRRRRGTAHDLTVSFLRTIRERPEIRLAPPGYHITLSGSDAVGPIEPPPRAGALKR